MHKSTFHFLLLGSITLLFSACSTLNQVWVEDDVYRLKSPDVPVDSDLSDETSYETFKYRKKKNLANDTYYHPENRNVVDRSPNWGWMMWGAPVGMNRWNMINGGMISSGMYWGPAWGSSFYNFGWGYNDPFFYGYGPYYFNGPIGPSNHHPNPRNYYRPRGSVNGSGMYGKQGIQSNSNGNAGNGPVFLSKPGGTGRPQYEPARGVQDKKIYYSAPQNNSPRPAGRERGGFEMNMSKPSISTPPGGGSTPRVNSPRRF